MYHNSAIDYLEELALGGDAEKVYKFLCALPLMDPEMWITAVAETLGRLDDDARQVINQFICVRRP